MHSDQCPICWKESEASIEKTRSKFPGFLHVLKNMEIHLFNILNIFTKPF